VGAVLDPWGSAQHAGHLHFDNRRWAATSAGIRPAGMLRQRPASGWQGMAVRGRHPSARHHPLAGTIAAKTQCGQANNSGTYIPRWQLARARLRSNRGRDHYVAMLTGPARPLDREAIFWHFPGYLGAGPGLLRTAPVSAVRMRRLEAAGVPGDGRQSCTTRADIGESATGAADMPDTTRSCRRSSMAGASRLRLTMPTRNEDRRENTEPRKRGGEQSNDGGRGDA